MLFRWCHIRHLNPQERNPQRIKKDDKQYIGVFDLECFSSGSIIVKHINHCLTINGKQAINMPKKVKNIPKFYNFHEQLPFPFVIYANFEAVTKMIQGCGPNDNKSYTKHYQNHEDCGYGYKVICCCKDKYSKPSQRYHGTNAVYKFMEGMLEEVEYCKGIVKKRFNKPLVMTENDELSFKLMDKCNICDGKYTDKSMCVRDHCHITGNSEDPLIKNVT